MVPEDRKKQILQLLEQHGYLTVEEIAQSLYASLPTIRRDLRSMDEEGIIRRTHGGASHISSSRKEFPFDLRSRTYLDEKRTIGQLALSLLSGNEHLFIDTGSSCYIMAEILDPNLPLTVLTNCIPTLQILSRKNQVKIECPCGEYNTRHRSICGDDAARFIDRRFADYYFASASGISLENGVNTLTPMDVAVKRAMNRNADKTVLLMDHSKIAKSHFYKAFEIADVDILISDRPLPGDMEEQCRKDHVEILTP